MSISLKVHGLNFKCENDTIIGYVHTSVYCVGTPPPLKCRQGGEIKKVCQYEHSSHHH